jgi:hypothetical protein
MDAMVAVYLIPVVVLVAAFIFGYVVPKQRRRRGRHSPIPLAPFGHAERPAIPPRPSRPPEPVSATAASDPSPPPSPPSPFGPSHSPDPIPIDVRASQATEEVGEERGRVLRLQVAGERRDFARDDLRGPTVRRERPLDGTLQFLPGRLEVIDGRDVGQEIKFVRTAGPDGTSVSFGRNEGPPYRHVQLHEPTVSRLHAKMTLDGKAWSLVNLSATNPVVVNGLPLEGEGSTVLLREGDRIEMGEVIFRYHVK